MRQNAVLTSAVKEKQCNQVLTRKAVMIRADKESSHDKKRQMRTDAAASASMSGNARPLLKNEAV